MNEKWTLEQVAWAVESEDIGYAIQDYLSAERIADPKLSEMWARAKTVLDEIDAYLKPYMSE